MVWLSSVFGERNHRKGGGRRNGWAAGSQPQIIQHLMRPQGRRTHTGHDDKLISDRIHFGKTNTNYTKEKSSMSYLIQWRQGVAFEQLALIVFLCYIKHNVRDDVLWRDILSLLVFNWRCQLTGHWRHDFAVRFLAFFANRDLCTHSEDGQIQCVQNLIHGYTNWEY